MNDNNETLPTQEGWYPEPSGTPDTLRWFNGKEWTNDYRPTAPPTPPTPVPPTFQPIVQKSRTSAFKVFLGVLAALVFFVVGCTALLLGGVNEAVKDLDTTTTTTMTTTTEATTETTIQEASGIISETTELPPPTEPDVPAEYRNALRSAEQYLDFTHFSQPGLVNQLEFEKYSTEAAEWAVANVEVDWNEQAAGSASDYLDFTTFSEGGLRDQLEFEKFTPDQIDYAITQMIQDGKL